VPYARNLGALRQPARDLEASAVMAREPHAHSAQAAQSEIHVVGSDAQAHGLHRVAQAARVLLVCGDDAQHDVGVSADVFRAGLDREIDALGERRKIQRARPGVVHQHHGVPGMRGFGDRRNVLHLERQRARRFGEHRAGVGLNQARDSRSDQWIVIGRRDAVVRQHVVAELPGRCVDAVGDKHVVAAAQHREKRDRNCGKSGGKQRDTRARWPLDLA